MPVTNAALGSFLRSRRERMDPDALGHTDVRRRRTPGLRREEVADEAGISVEWYTKLEQGRAVSPPPATVNGLARALRLDAPDHAHLKRLAGLEAGSRFVREGVPSALRQFVERLPHPAYLTGLRWDVLAWSPAADDLFGDFGAIPKDERNILLRVLTDPATQILFGAGWPTEARRMVALFRSTFDLFSTDPAFTSLVERVRQGCPSFEGWWRDHDVRMPSSGRKTLHTPEGSRSYDYATFQANEAPALKLAIYMPACA